SAINDINASFGTEVNNLLLPEKITLNLSDGTTAIVDATWSSTDYDGTKTAAYSFTAIYTLPKGVTGNMPEAKLNVTVGLNPDLAQNNRLKTYKSSDYLKSEYVDMTVINNEKITVKGQCSLDKTAFMFEIVDQAGNDIMQQWKDVKTDGTYDETFAFNNLIKNGDYKVNIYFKSKNESSYWSYYWNIPFKNQEGSKYFPLSTMYNSNYTNYNKNLAINPKYYLDTDLNNVSEENELKLLADDIIKDTSSDYDKILKIHDWVSENIYYNMDGYYSGNYGETDAYGTFTNKMSVCQGYAELTNELIRMAGIPCRVVTGYAIRVESQSWETVDHTNPDHAWNEAFVDGRWVIIDTTWDSTNRYENGIFTKGDIRHIYFDPTLKAFSLDHKIISN
ncbi:transglutaminase domain-containing protein, partial [Clostridium frigoriphilum]